MTVISVVTPTLGRPDEVRDLLENLKKQIVLPAELILVDGAGPHDRRTEGVVTGFGELPFEIHYIRHGGGTAIQRNVGIDEARGAFIALIDDDIRLESDFFEKMLEVFERDREGLIGGQTGYITNQFLDPETSPRWRWNRRLRVFSTYEPGRFDYKVGYPINRYLRPPHTGTVEIDFMGAGCALWRAEVFANGQRFDSFFSGFGVLEDAHFALRARRAWVLLENGDTRCIHLKSSTSREAPFKVACKTAVNYRYVFVDIVRDRSLSQEVRFWSVQLLDLLRFLVAAVRHPGGVTAATVFGKVVGIFRAMTVKASTSTGSKGEGEC